MDCVLKKPDGVCCEFNKKEHIGVTVSNSQFGWDADGYCVVDVMALDAQFECSMYEADEDPE